MDRTILEWLPEKNNPEVRLRTMKEYEKLPDDDERIAECRKLLLAAELHLRGHRAVCEEALTHYFTKRNIFYRTDDMQTPMADVMLGTFYPPDSIKIGAHQIIHALRVLGCAPESEAAQ